MTFGLPVPIIGEHVNGVLARYCVWEGHTAFRKLIRSVTTKDIQLNNKYFWRENFEAIWRLYGGILSREQLLASHTAFLFNSIFLPEEILQTITRGPLHKSLSFNGVKNIKYNNVWRWCSKCIEEDKLKVGSRYWHVVHQIPTILRCPIHGAKLNYGCACKNFYFNKLANYPLPPRDNICPSCHKIIQTDIVDLSDEELWLESFTLKALKKKPQSRLIDIKKALKSALALPNYEGSLSKADRMLIREYQHALEYLVLDWHYESFFEFPNFENSIYKPPICINLFMLIYSEEFFAPLSYIASLRMFYSQSEVEKILLGESCGL